MDEALVKITDETVGVAYEAENNETFKKVIGWITKHIDLIVCEVCSVSVALIVDCIVFFDYFNNPVIPVVFIVVLAVASAASVIGKIVYSNNKK